MADTQSPHTGEQVTEADRIAAAELIEAYWQGSGEGHNAMRRTAQSYRAGHTQGVWSHDFARHRLTTAARQPEAPAQDALREAASCALMYLETGFVECERCGNEVATKNLDAAYELREALSLPVQDAETVERLKPYLQHKQNIAGVPGGGCMGVWPFDRHPCTCGLNYILTATADPSPCP